MKRVFKVKDADKTVQTAFLNGLKQEKNKDYTLNKNSVKILGQSLKKGEKLTIIQETTFTV